MHCTTWDDSAIMSMAESGLGVSILPELILKRMLYRPALNETDIPVYRSIGSAVKSKKHMPPAVKKFIEYLNYRTN